MLNKKKKEFKGYNRGGGLLKLLIIFVTLFYGCSAQFCPPDMFHISDPDRCFGYTISSTIQGQWANQMANCHTVVPQRTSILAVVDDERTAQTLTQLTEFDPKYQENNRVWIALQHVDGEWRWRDRHIVEQDENKVAYRAWLTQNPPSLEYSHVMNYSNWEPNHPRNTANMCVTLNLLTGLWEERECEGPDGAYSGLCELVDINPCDNEADPCEVNANTDCVFTKYKSYECVCKEGFERTDDGLPCQDIDECLDKNKTSKCVVCVNTKGGFDCKDRDEKKIIKGSEDDETSSMLMWTGVVIGLLLLAGAIFGASMAAWKRKRVSKCPSTAKDEPFQDEQEHNGDITCEDPVTGQQDDGNPALREDGTGKKSTRPSEGLRQSEYDAVDGSGVDGVADAESPRTSQTRQSGDPTTERQSGGTTHPPLPIL